MRRTDPPARPRLSPLLVLLFAPALLAAQDRPGELLACDGLVTLGMSTRGADEYEAQEGDWGERRIWLQGWQGMGGGVAVGVRLDGLNRNAPFTAGDLRRGELLLDGSWPDAGAALRAEIGAVYEPDFNSPIYPLGLMDGRGQGLVEAILPVGVGSLVAGGERRPALETRESVSRPLRRWIESWWAGLERGVGDWRVRVEYRRDYLGFGNRRWSAIGELRFDAGRWLAPGVELGYRFTARDSRRPEWMRGEIFDFIDTAQLESVPWRYSRAYTPLDLRVHELLADVRAASGEGVVLYLRASLSPYASDLRPVFPLEPGVTGAEASTARRAFYPASISAEVTGQVGDHLEIAVAGRLEHGSLVDEASLQVTATHHIVAASR